MIAPFRTQLYSTWRCCERFNLLPPDISYEWDNNNIWTQAKLIAYNNIREFEEFEEQKNMYQALGAKVL